MKRKIKILGIFILIISFLILLNTKANAAMEIKEGATGYIVSNPTTNAFSICYDLRNPTSTLAKNSLDPHLTLASDWASMLYLGLSGYGNITSNNDTKTTANKSGVVLQNTASCYPVTSSVVKENVTDSDTSLIKQKMNTKYVSRVSKEGNNKGLGLEELLFINGNNSVYYNSVVYQYRFNLKVSNLSSSNNTWKWMNARPVIWN